MRKSIFLSGAAVFVAVFLPVLVRAQFQQPTDEELKMTADPKAPGAAAVYLNIKEIANDPIHYQSYYARIKVLTEKGKELATVEIPYMQGNKKVTDIKGRTIHSDGTVIPLTVKPEDLLTAKSGDMQFGKKVFTLPSVEVGSILEYQYDLRYDDNHFSSPEWGDPETVLYSFGALPVHAIHRHLRRPELPAKTRNHFLIDARGHTVSSLMWWNRLPPGVTVKTSMDGSYSVDVADVPPIPDEEWMPPVKSLLYKVFFDYKEESSAQDFWVSEIKYWLKDVDKFAEPSKAIRDAVNGLIVPTDSDLDKARKLYAAVQALDNTDYSRKKSESEMKELKIKEAKHAADTWEQKSGSSEDIAMLYLAMLHAAGLTAYPMKIVDREEGIFDPTYLSLDQLDTTLVSLTTGGKSISLDPGEKTCPFGTLNWRHSGAQGIGEGPQGPVIVITPEQIYKENTISRSGDVTLDMHGGITGNFSIIMTGQEALRWRQAALRNDVDELKKQFDRDLEKIVPEGVEAHIDHFLGIDQSDVNLIALVKVSGSLGTATAKRLILPGFFFETRSHQSFVSQEKRMEPVDMHYGDHVTDQVTFHLPTGITVEGAPQDASISWPAHAVFIAKSKVDPGQIIIADALASAFTQAKPEEYQDLRGFYQKIAAADQEELVLTATPTAAAGKGN